MNKLPLGAINQFNYVTRDMEKSITHWVETFSAGPFFCWELPDPDLTPTRTYRGEAARDTFKACYGFMGATMLEFMQPTNDAPSLLREVLDVTGEGLQHIFPGMRPLNPGEYDEIASRYVENGFASVSEATVPLYGRNAFFDARHTTGVFIELVELLPPSFEIIERMYEVHRRWDGRRPVRSMNEIVDEVMGTNTAREDDKLIPYWGEEDA